ncbi:MAG: class B sortase [Clostridia bacterium]|nr:class B sortase [Clostridia bacterium]
MSMKENGGAGNSRKQTTASAGFLKFLTDSGNRILGVATAVLAALLILYSGYVLYDTYYIQQSAVADWDLSRYARIAGNEDEPLTGNMMKEINEDYRSWLALYDTSISYPVVQGLDDLYYASHDIYKKVSLTGAIYLAGANTEDYTGPYNLVYGHHMDNEAMFGGLDNYLGYDYFRSHTDGILVTMKEIYDLKVFAVMKTDAYEPRVYSLKDKTYDGQIEFIRSCIGNEEGNRTVFFDGTDIDKAEKIVALSTCASAETNGRLVVFALMIKRDASYNPDDPLEAIIIKPSEDGGEKVDPPKRPGQNGKGKQPMIPLLENFIPRGNREPAWALVNLICTVLTVYLWLPLLHIIEKFRRRRLMQEMNREHEKLIDEEPQSDQEKLYAKCINRAAAILGLKQEAGKEPDADEIRTRITGATDEQKRKAVPFLWYRVSAFAKKFAAGFAVEVLFAAAAVVTFILTEDMRAPMTLIDGWTPVMILYLLIQWVLDIMLMRYREGVLIEDEERLCRELMLK